MRTTYINLPQRDRKPSNRAFDPFFEIEVQKYLREDGEFDGTSAIVNKETRRTLGAIKKGYNVVTHKEASDTIRGFLDQINMPYELGYKATATKGAKFYELIRFPHAEFTPNGTSTALDSHDERMVPYIIVKNSYDKTSALSYEHGVARFICTNGMKVGVRDKMLMSYRHNQKINLDAIRDGLISGIDRTMSIVQKAYNKLNGESGMDYLRDLIEGDYPSKFKLAVLEKITPYASIEQEIIEEEGKKVLKIKSITTPESAWAVYNVATEVTTHVLTSPTDQSVVGNKLAKKFAVV